MPSNRTETTSEGDVRAVVRALSILDVFDAQHTSLTLQEISERLGMAKATTFRLVNTVCRAGYLVRLSDQRYCLSLKLARLGSMVRSTLSIRDVALPVMQEVNRVTGETITLNVVNAAERVCIEVVDTPAPLMTIVRVGEHVPLLFGATGRILLSQMDDAAVDAIVRATPGGDKVDRIALDRELKRFRSQGYALTRSQRVQGVTAISVPLRSSQSKDIYCLALTGPSVRVDLRELEFIDLMVDAGRQIANSLGTLVTRPGVLAAQDEVGTPSASEPAATPKPRGRRPRQPVA